MRLLVDLTEPLEEWVEFLSDLSCNLEDIRESLYIYDPGVDSMFIDGLIESYDPAYSDDIIENIIRSSTELLRDKIDYYMKSMGYEISRIIQVITGLGSTVIFAIVDAVPIYLVTRSVNDNACGYNRPC